MCATLENRLSGEGFSLSELKSIIHPYPGFTGKPKINRKALCIHEHEMV